MALRSPRSWLIPGLALCVVLAALLLVQRRRAPPAAGPATQASAAPAAPAPAPPLAAGPAKGVDLLSNPLALDHYKILEFERAAKVIQSAARDTAGLERAEATARDILQVQTLMYGAVAMQDKNPAEALQRYQEAERLDQRISGGALARNIKSSIKALSERPAPAPQPAAAPAHP